MSSYSYKLAAYVVLNINLGLILIILHPSSHFCPHPSFKCHVYSFLLLLFLNHLVPSSSFIYLFIFWFPALISLFSGLPSCILTFPISSHPSEPPSPYAPHLYSHFFFTNTAPCVIFVAPFHISFCHYVAGPSDQDAQEEGEKCRRVIHLKVKTSFLNNMLPNSNLWFTLKWMT